MTAKRFFDIFCSIAAILIFSPVLLLASAAILLDGGPPVLYRAPRVGKGRQRFICYKLRTMRDGKEVTSPGRWLRASGLDELPQFLNVWHGEMSVVGPRALDDETVDRLGWNSPERGYRWSVLPGITGLAQLYPVGSAEQSWLLDVTYLRERSTGLDARIVALSFLANVLGKRRVRALVRLAGALPGRISEGRGRRAPRAMTTAPRLDGAAVVGAPQPRRVLLLNPFYSKDPVASFGKHVLTPSTALTAIAAATPASWNVQFWDENLLQGPPPRDPFPSVVGITVHLTFAARAFALADWYRERGAKVVLGGLHVVSNPEECAEHADALVLGDGVPVWPRVLADAERGLLAPRYDGAYHLPFAANPEPQRRALPRGQFLTTAGIIATRGCHNRCGFCYLATDGLHLPYQTRPAAEVAAEISRTGEPYAVFIDNNLGSRKAYLHELCRALAPLDKIWSAAVSIDVTDDPELVHAMADSGCTGVFVGFESLTQENLSEARKKTPLPEDYGRRVALLHHYGIQVNGSFVLGFDHDGPEVFAETVRWIEAHRLECATFHILTPYPGTPLFRRLEGEGRILHRDWRLYDTGHVVFQPAKLSIDELASGYAWCYRRLFSPQSIVVRRPAHWQAIPGYLAMSLLYKKANWLWPLVIRHGLTNAFWRPLVEAARRQNVRARKRRQEPGGARAAGGAPVAPGV
ncbi:MAG: sugar transferase [Candidatus Schekmanbacteria bacterium]|nr:sugar transferase [Candidatus Schekmanbacteria bacterium]